MTRPPHAAKSSAALRRAQAALAGARRELALERDRRIVAERSLAASEEATRDLLAALSPREATVLRLVARGMSNKLIAAELGISIKTVEKHRQNLMDKLDIHDTAGLTRYAIAARLVTCT